MHTRRAQDDLRLGGLSTHVHTSRVHSACVGGLAARCPLIIAELVCRKLRQGRFCSGLWPSSSL